MRIDADQFGTTAHRFEQRAKSREGNLVEPDRFLEVDAPDRVAEGSATRRFRNQGGAADRHDG